MGGGKQRNKWTEWRHIHNLEPKSNFKVKDFQTMVVILTWVQVVLPPQSVMLIPSFFHLSKNYLCQELCWVCVDK